MAAGSDNFREIDVIRDPDGLAAVITERRDNGRVSFMIAREFERNGQTMRSAFIARRHLPGARRLLEAVEDRLDQIEDRTRAQHRAVQ
jgi:hypothetical protein